MEVGSLTGATSAAGATSVSGFAALSAGDFMQMLLAELQNQDPLNPMENEQLLSQLSTMQSLQSNVELSQALGDLATGQTMSAAAGLIGKSVSGTLGGQVINGTVDRATMVEGELQLGFTEHGRLLPLSLVESVTG